MGTEPNPYVISYGGSPTVPQLQCTHCGERPPIKSNLAIAEERTRLLADLQPQNLPKVRKVALAENATTS
jgi:hypothetical protein